jgi:hypothetical protein
MLNRSDHPSRNGKYRVVDAPTTRRTNQASWRLRSTTAEYALGDVEAQHRMRVRKEYPLPESCATFVELHLVDVLSASVECHEDASGHTTQVFTLIKKHGAHAFDSDEIIFRHARVLSQPHAEELTSSGDRHLARGLLKHAAALLHVPGVAPLLSSLVDVEHGESLVAAAVASLIELCD